MTPAVPGVVTRWVDMLLDSLNSSERVPFEEAMEPIEADIESLRREVLFPWEQEGVT